MQKKIFRTDRRLDFAAIALVCAMGALCLAVLVALPGLAIDPRLGLRLPPGSLRAEADAVDELFPPRSAVLAFLPASGPFTPQALALLSSASATLERAGEDRDGSGPAWQVISPLTTQDLSLEGDALVSTPLVGGPDDDPRRVRYRIESSPLFKSLFISGDGAGWTMILETNFADEALLRRIDEARSECPELLFAGLPYALALNGRILRNEFYLILAATALALLVAEYLLFRKLRVALLLWSFSLVPALLLLGLYVLTGTALRLHLVLAPGLAICLSTSYVVHLYHGWRSNGLDARGALRSRGRLIVLDAATTVLGFSSLFSSPVPELRQIAAFSIAAALIPLATTAFGLAPILHLVARRREALPFAEDDLSVKAASPRARLAVPAIWALGTAVLAYVALGLSSGYEPKDLFTPGSAARIEAETIARSYSGVEEVDVMVETGSEYGLLDPAVYRAVRDLALDLGSHPGVAGVHSYPDAVGEVLARLRGLPGTAEPSSAEEIGEALELLSSRSDGSSVRLFVDSDWSAAMVRLSMRPTFRAVRDMAALRAAAAASSSAHGLPTPAFGGMAVRAGAAEELFIKGQFIGDILFFITLIAGLALVLRSLKKAFVVAMAPVTGLLASLAVLAALGWPFSSVHAIALGVVLGTGVDNAIMISLGGWTGESRAVSAEAALLVACGFAAFLGCSSYFMIQTAIACMAGLGASALVANTLVPVLLATDDKA